MQADYTIHAHHQHLSWDNARPPAVTVTPGETVEFRDIDALCGQITPQSTAADLANLDFARIDPLAGPVYVDGAEVGDALVVTPVGMDTAGWGWTAIIPGYGVLAEDFPAPSLHHWSYAPDLSAPAMFSGIAQVPLRPFCATMGTAPATDGALATIPTYSWGGSMALRDVTVGVDLYLPVQVPGGLFSLSDPHAAQGDGEVCGTALEAPMSVTVKFDLVKDARLRSPRFVAHGPIRRHLDQRGYEATTGINGDLMDGARDALRAMIDLLTRQHRMAADAAYMLCSVCADLRITQAIDAAKVVTCYMPRSIFE